MIAFHTFNLMVIQFVYIKDGYLFPAFDNKTMLI